MCSSDLLPYRVSYCDWKGPHDALTGRSLRDFYSRTTNWVAFKVPPGWMADGGCTLMQCSHAASESFVSRFYFHAPRFLVLLSSISLV